MDAPARISHGVRVMPHYIDADTVVTIQVYNDMTEEYGTKRVTIADAIDEWSDEGCPPFADVPDRKVGKWEWKEDPFGFFDTIPVCSECGHTTKMRETYAYCPNCGARMKGEGDEPD